MKLLVPFSKLIHLFAMFTARTDRIIQALFPKEILVEARICRTLQSLWRSSEMKASAWHRLQRTQFTQGYKLK